MMSTFYGCQKKRLEEHSNQENAELAQKLSEEEA